MVKILIINSTLERSGLTNVFYNLVKHLDKSQFDIHILTLSKEPMHSRLNDFEQLNVNLHRLQLEGVRRFFFNKTIIQEKIKSIAPDIIHTFSFRGNFFASRYLKIYPRIVTIQADLKENYQVDYGRFFGKIVSAIELHIDKSANYITVCSNTLAKKYGYFKNLSCIPNGVSQQNYFALSINEKEKLRIKFNLDFDKEVFVCAGLINERKDSLTVVKAFLEYATQKQVLFMVGSGTLLDACKELANNNPQIYFTGMVDTVMDYIGMADFFISASLSEGMPNAVLEAGFAGLNLILSNIPAHLELKENNCIGMCYFDSSNKDDLGRLIQSFQRSEVKMSEIYSANSMASSFQDIYIKLFGNKLN
jgi:glycosyltransferase involved in cell wall biosynthesis